MDTHRAREQMDLWLEYMKFAFQGGFLGNVVYEVKLNDGSIEYLFFAIDEESITTARGVPDATVLRSATCRLSMTIDVWRAVLSGSASSVDLISWILAAKISVHPLQWMALKTFATSFEYSESCWSRFYTASGPSKARRYRAIVAEIGASDDAQCTTQPPEPSCAGTVQEQCSWYGSHPLGQFGGFAACGVCPLVAYRYASSKPGSGEQKDGRPKGPCSEQPRHTQRSAAQSSIFSASQRFWGGGGNMAMATLAATAVGCAAIAIRAAQPLRC
jgi:hypothetical protein